MVRFYEYSYFYKCIFSCYGEGYCDLNVEKGVFVVVINWNVSDMNLVLRLNREDINIFLVRMELFRGRVFVEVIKYDVLIFVFYVFCSIIGFIFEIIIKVVWK